MNGIKSIDQNTLSIQIKSLMIYEFLKEYNKLERMIRGIFEKNIPLLPNTVIQQLYFYSGGRIGTYIDVEEESVKLSAIKYKDNDLFKELTINQIVKIFKKNSCLKAFNFEISSVQRATTEYSFYDCAIRLLNMRNILAHEMVDIQFKNKDLIELLTFDQLEKHNFEILQNYDIHVMDNMTQYIASNIVYMRKIIDHLRTLMEE
ncbi:hypothetical protein [Blautia sp. MSJ-9]|uniref:hypothetical protein n=1 Tax=Blautia sp. MSJ-9 TaxID=2841511 RepID=UPI001C102078|nr:hypothetical protein [Blautia sp. MSJ-9]MBU5680932.1 hypothetical protein [Blautia sp. MSJ-9]